jgi:MFS family permease
MFQEDQEYAIAFLVLSSVGGSVVGAVVGGFLEEFAPLIWIFWTQMIFGFFVQALHFFLVPETRSTLLLDREAQRRRAEGETNIWGPKEIDEHRLTVKEVLTIWIRPFHMLFTVSVS